MPEVTDETFETALADEDNYKILLGLSLRFKGRLPPEELKYRSYMALFNCLRHHDPEKPNKFTTSLHWHMKRQCLKALREERRRQESVSLPDLAVPDRGAALMVRDCLENLPKYHSDILRQYYYDKLTLREIGEQYGFSQVTAMHRLREAEAAFRGLYRES